MILIVYFVVYLWITITISFIGDIYSTGCGCDVNPIYPSYKGYIEAVIRKIDYAVTFKGKIIYALFLAIFVIVNFAEIITSGFSNLVTYFIHLVTDFIHNNFDFNSKG